MGKLLTIAVCTHNRAELLEKCLDALSKQTATADQYDVIIVDNSSTDNTEELCRGYCRANHNFYYFKENKVGLSFARSRAIQECGTPYLGYIDDDAYPLTNYVEVAVSCIKSGHYAVLGGGQIPVWNNTLPEWFDVPGKRYDDTKILVDDFLDGFNIIFEKKKLVDIGGFNARIGMRGNKVAYGEETLAQLLIRKSGGVIIFLPDLLVYHLINDYKLKLSWQLKSHFAMGRDYWITFSRSVSFRDRIYIFRQANFGFFKRIFSLAKSGERKKEMVRILNEYFLELGKAFGHSK